MADITIDKGLDSPIYIDKDATINEIQSIKNDVLSYKVQASNSEANAEAYALSASNSLDSINDSVADIGNKTAEASSYANNASISAVEAEGFKDEASTQSTNASTSATQASISASNANSSATLAEGYKDTALAQASITTTKASEAFTSASEALASRNEAQVDRIAVNETYQEFLSVYIGKRDNLNIPDLSLYDDGSLYFNTDTNTMYVRSNGEWKVAVIDSDTLTDIQVIADNILDINTVGTNISSVIDIANDVLPNMTEILQADDNALIATTKASEATNASILATASASSASTSASNALTSETNASASEANALAYKDLAETYKNTTLGYRNETEVFRDDTEVYVNSVSGLVDNINANTALSQANYSSILQIAKSNTIGSFGNSSLNIPITNTKAILPFDVQEQSTNTDRFVINNDNTITAKELGTYLFTSTINIEDSGANGDVVTLTFTITDGTNDFYSQDVNVEISGYNRDVISVNSLVVLDNASYLPATAYITVECPSVSNNDYTIAGFQSILSTEKSLSEIQGLADSIVVSPSGNLDSVDVQSALEELQGDIDNLTTITEW